MKGLGGMSRGACALQNGRGDRRGARWSVAGKTRQNFFCFFSQTALLEPKRKDGSLIGCAPPAVVTIPAIKKRQAGGFASFSAGGGTFEVDTRSDDEAYLEVNTKLYTWTLYFVLSGTYLYGVVV